MTTQTQKTVNYNFDTDIEAFAKQQRRELLVKARGSLRDFFICNPELISVTLERLDLLVNPRNVTYHRAEKPPITYTLNQQITGIHESVCAALDYLEALIHTNVNTLDSTMIVQRIVIRRTLRKDLTDLIDISVSFNYVSPRAEALAAGAN